MNIRYIGAVAQQDAVAEGWIEQRGRTLVFCRAEVRTEDGKLAADGTLTYTVRPPARVGVPRATRSHPSASTLDSMYRRLLPLLLATALLAACMQEGEDPLEAGTTTTEDDGSATTTTPATASFTPDPIEWDDCGAVECATLDVPLDYEDPDGEQIELYVARTPASGDRIGALFVNPGGPGAGARRVRRAASRTCCPRRSPSTSTSSGVDPRGVGGSTPIDCGVTPTELYGVDPTFEDAADEDGLPRGQRGVRRRLRRRSTATCSPTSARRTSPATWTPCAPRWATSSSATSASATAPPSVRCTPTCSPTGSARWCSTASSSSGRPGSSWPTSRPPGSRRPSRASWSTATPPRAAPRPATPLEAVEEVLAARRGARRHPRRRTPTAPPAPARPTSASATPSTRRASGQTSADALADALDGDGSGLVELADGYLGIGDFEIYFAVNCLDFAWPAGDPDAFFAPAKATAERRRRTSARRS